MLHLHECHRRTGHLSISDLSCIHKLVLYAVQMTLYLKTLKKTIPSRTSTIPESVSTRDIFSVRPEHTTQEHIHLLKVTLGSYQEIPSLQARSPYVRPRLLADPLSHFCSFHVIVFYASRTNAYALFKDLHYRISTPFVYEYNTFPHMNTSDSEVRVLHKLGSVCFAASPLLVHPLKKSRLPRSRRRTLSPSSAPHRRSSPLSSPRPLLRSPSFFLMSGQRCCFVSLAFS